MNLGFNTIFTKNNQITVREAKDLVLAGGTAKMVLPLWIGEKQDAEWLFPIEPLMSISGKNVIVKRNVSKQYNYRGTIKERWSEDDIAISIQGSFVHPDMKKYPADDVEKLMYYIRRKEALYVKNDLLQLLNVNQIVIESFSFPFSKGENVQNFTIDAVSDDLYELFIDVKDAL